MTRARRRIATGIAVVIALVVAPLVLGDPAGLLAILPERVAPTQFAPPPSVRIAQPLDGDGVATSIVLSGEARAGFAEGLVTDVQARVDGGAWTTVITARGAPALPFAMPLALAPGDHALEARAFDGAAFSPIARVLVRAGTVPPPTIHILQPADGQGVASGTVQVRGTIATVVASGVFVRSGDQVVSARIVSAGPVGSLWDAPIDLGPGLHAIEAYADGNGGSLPRRIAVAAAPNAPATLDVVRPANGTAFGSAGDKACDGACILFAGVVTPGATRVRVSLDGASEESVALVDDAWTWHLDVGNMFDGEHVARFVAATPDGDTAPRYETFYLRNARHLDVAGDATPRPTGTPLDFKVRTTGDYVVHWSLDDAPVGDGVSVRVLLATPGDHTLTARVTDPQGRGAIVRTALYALNRPPSVTATVAPALAAEPSLFRASGTDPDGTILGYVWEFGDGETLTTSGGAVEHAYQRPGDYEANVTVVDDSGGQSAPFPLRATVPDAPPVARFSWTPTDPTVLDDVTFADASFDPNGAVVAREWSFGDGNGSALAAPVHRFATRGDHAIALTVTDGDGSAATLVRTLHVRDVPPVASFTIAPTSVVTRENVTFRDASSKPDGTILSRSWDFGDGLRGEGKDVTHAYDAPGRYRVTLAIEDDHGLRASATDVVAVSDAVPKLRAIVADPAFPHGMDAVSFSADATDVEGIPRLAWDFGDDVTSDETAPVHRYAKSGDYLVTATATDASGQRTIQTLKVHVANAPPTVTFDPVDVAYAAFPITLSVDPRDADGSIVDVAFDADGDGVPDCVGESRVCTWTYPTSGAYTARVKVTDDEGGTVEATRVLDVLPPPQGLAPPRIRIDAPTDGGSLRGAVVASGTAAGASPIRLVELQLRDAAYALGSVHGAWIAARGAENWSAPLDTRAYPDGAFDLVIRATDSRGNANESRVRVTIDNAQRTTQMTLRILDLQPEQVVNGDLNVRGSAYHPGGVSGVRWRVDQQGWRAVSGNLVSWTIPLKLRDLQPGEHALDVEAYHGVVERANVTIPFRVGEAAPFLYVEQAPAPVAYGILHAEGRSRPDVVVLWRVDAGVWREARGNASWVLDAPSTALESGPHTLALKAASLTTGLESEVVSFPVRVLNARAAVQTALPTARVAHDTPGSPVASSLILAAALALLTRSSRRRSS